MGKASEEWTGRINLRVSERQERGGREFGARAVLVDAINDEAAAFYQHFGFHELEGRRLWRRLNDIATAVGIH